MVGKTIGKYRILGTVGRGGMGTVYRAVDETLDRAVAIKALNPGLAEDDQVRRFHAEAVTLARVSHPNIATVYELVREGDQLMMVMEFVSGETIERLLERSGALPIGRAATLVAQTLDALGHAHRAGIVHRDLKPANLMLTEYGGVKVTDFGIARVRGTERMTTDGLLIGTPAYMAPEQVRGEDVDGRTDLYAVGVVFYRMVTGGLPFAANTPVAMIHAQLQDAPVSPRTLRPDLPAWLEGVLIKALAKSRADRYQTAELFRDALGPANVPPPPGRESAVMPDDLDVTALSGQTPVRSAALPPSVTATPATGTAGPPTIVLDRLHIAFAGIVVALLVAIIAVLAWIAFRSSPSASTPAPAAVLAPASAPAPAPAPTPPVRSEGNPAPAARFTPPPVARPAPASREALPPPASPPAAVATVPAAPPAGAVDTRATQATPARGDGEPPVARGERGFPGAFRGRGAAPVGSSPVVRDVDTLVMLGGRGRLLPSHLTFSDRAIDVANPNTGVTVRSIPFADIQHVTLSRGVRPRGTGGAELPVLGALARGNVAAPGGPRIWLALETADNRLVLRLDPPHLRPVLDLVSQRIPVRLERYGGQDGREGKNGGTGR